MRHKIIVLAIEGYAASARKDEDTLSASVEKVFNWKILKGMIEEGHCHITEMNSFKYSCVKNIAANLMVSIALSQAYDKIDVVCIGKSMGAAKLLHGINKYIKHCLKDPRKAAQLAKVNSFNLMFIDPHGKPRQEWFSFKPTYGKRRDLEIPHHWWKVLPNLSISNYYQQEEYPEGAKVIGANPVVKLTDCDHWNITEHKEVIKGLKDIRWRITQSITNTLPLKVFS